MLGIIVLAAVIAYSIWVFVVHGCLGGSWRGYRQYRADRNEAHAKLQQPLSPARRDAVMVRQNMRLSA